MQSSDNWYRVSDAVGATKTIRRRRWRRVLLAVGRKRQAAFDSLAGCKLYIRRQGAPSRPEGRHEILGTRGPFTVDGERRLFRKLQIDAIVAHDAGGAGGWPKIEAARHARLPVVLIDRPEPPDARIIETPAQALSWLASL